MVFSSLTFLFLFFPAVFLLYYLGKNRIYRNIVLLIFSLLFYSWGEPVYVILMIISTFCAYLGGLFIRFFKIQNMPIAKNVSFVITVTIMLAFLLYFKYANFIVENLNLLFGLRINLDTINLPIGISFFTFQALSYVIDLYLGNCKFQRNYFYLLLYISLFPQLIAGPIVRYKTVEDEIRNRSENWTEVANGLNRFVIGLSKKVLIANNVALIANEIYAAHEPFYGTAIYWIAIIAYALQIYFDFSGYSDMAIGLGMVFGFHFEENFNYPYSAKSITDFWRRWHMSLSTFFRDYVYIPLGGSRKGNFRLIINLLIVWFLTGLWHGANWNFILWGMYYGIVLILEKLAYGKILEKFPGILRHLYSIILILVGWVIFESVEVSDIVFRLTNMFTYTETNWPVYIYYSSSYALSFIAFFIGIIVSFPIFKPRGKVSGKFMISVTDIFSIVLLILCIISIVSSTFNPFIYFRF